MVRNFALPEDWKALRRYIARTLHGRQVSAAREAVGQAQHHSSLSPEEAEAAQRQKRSGHPRTPKRPLLVPHDAQDQRLYGVDEIVRILEAEAAEGVWVPSRDTLYDWGNAGLFARHRDERQRKYLNEDGVNEIRARVEAERAYRNSIKRAEEVGMSRAAIKKAIQRGRLETIIARHEAARQHRPCDAPDRREEVPSLEEVRQWMRDRLEQPNLTADERNDLHDKLRQLCEMRERCDGSERLA